MNKPGYFIIAIILFITFITLTYLKWPDNKNSSSDKTNIYEEKINQYPGKDLYTMHCARCHGEDGKKRLYGAKDLSSSNRSMEKIITRMKEGKTPMPSFKDILSEEQMYAIAKYIKENIEK